MSDLRVPSALALCLLLAVAGTACHLAGQSPQLHVLGVREQPRHEVVFVQVTNPASHPMRLTRLEYTFAAAGATVAKGELALARDVPSGAAVVVEVPLVIPPDAPPEKAMTLSGTLTTELDQLVQSFPVSAQIVPPAATN